jgi:hypothetical protein
MTTAHDGDEEDEPLFEWGNENVRPTDPDTSHEAAASLDIKGDEIEALEWFERFYSREWGLTAAEFREGLEAALHAAGWDRQKAQRRSESLRRRLTGLERKGKIEVRQGPAGRRSGNRIYWRQSLDE